MISATGLLGKVRASAARILLVVCSNLPLLKASEQKQVERDDVRCEGLLRFVLLRFGQVLDDRVVQQNPRAIVRRCGGSVRRSS